MTAFSLTNALCLLYYAGETKMLRAAHASEGAEDYRVQHG